MILLDGKKISEQILEEIRIEVETLKKENKKVPHLAVVLVGNNPASETYVGSKIKTCDRVGFQSTLIRLPDTIAEEALLQKIKELNEDPSIDGFIVQSPLPKHISDSKVIHAISARKDVDGFHPENLGRMALNMPAYISATPFGVWQLLDRYNIPTAGKHCVVMGRSHIVGLPMSLLMMRNTKPGNCTVTVCHSKTVDLKKYTLQADILIVATGQTESVTADMVKEGAVVVDVGISRVPDASKKSGYRIAGDVKFDEVAPKCSYITPVPGGVGPMTIASLLMNTLVGVKMRYKESTSEKKKTLPIKEVIDRTMDVDLSNLLSVFANGIEECVNYGSNIVSWDLERKEGSDEDFAAILLLLDFLKEIDGISILVKHSSIAACKNLLRTTLEKFFYLSYIFQTDTSNRSMSYLVCNIIRDIKFLTKVDGSSSEYRQFEKKWQKDKYLKNITDKIKPAPTSTLEALNKVLGLPKYLPIKQEYDRTQLILSKKKVEWYSLFDGPKNIEDLANKLDLPAFYEILYRHWSQSVHANNTFQASLSFDIMGNPELNANLRYPKDAQSITQHCLSLTSMIFKTYIENRLPNKLHQYLIWYQQDLSPLVLALNRQQLVNILLSE